VEKENEEKADLGRWNKSPWVREKEREVRLLPLNAQRDSTMRGLIFVFFIALILRMRVVKLMQEKRLTSRYNLEGMHIELEKIRKIELSDGEALASELTKETERS